MSGRSQTLMRTRCPVCGTVFRVTSEQLRFKAGKVRCGHCQALFNAFDSLMPDETPAPQPDPSDEPLRTAPVLSPEAVSPVPPPATPPSASPSPAVSAALPGALAARPAMPAETDADDTPSEPARPPEPVAETAPAVPADDDASADPVAPVVAPEPVSPLADAPPRLEPQWAPEPDPVPPPAAVPDPTPVPELPAETPEESAQAAREAGLMAARELTGTPAFNRWAVGTLASDGPGGFASEPARPVWPFALIAALLVVVLAAQAAHHFRSDIVRSWPEAGALYSALGVSVPLPRNPDLVAIETSDLQSDARRGLFVLQATLKNRAAYRQAWPSLELTLTDTQDTVLTRRVLAPVEYLPPGTEADHFAAEGEIGLRLWLESRGVAAAGYRLYLFYP